VKRHGEEINRLSQSVEVKHTLMQSIEAGFFYFLLVFGAGFLLGPIRILLLVPRVGTRTAELLEAPLMSLVIIISAKFVIRRCDLVTTLGRVSIGCIALGLLLVAEFSLVLWLRGMSVGDYLATRDPVSGTVYYVMLLVFAATPMFIRK